MTTAAPPRAMLTGDALGQLMPMYLWLDAAGVIRGIGPTLEKILGGRAVLGTPLRDHFQLRFARSGAEEVGAVPPLRRLHLVPLAHPDLSLRGVAAGLGAAGDGGVLLNLTFGVHLADAVRVFNLTEADFAASDLAIEVLYMGEANAAVLGELSALTGRLEMARRTAVAQAMSDSLTGLANRRGFDQALRDEIAAMAQGGAPFALAHLDLDYFKQVNDTFGHAAGDHVLMMAAQRLAGELRRGDLVARTGGDEFLLLMRGAVNRDALQRLGERLIGKLEEPYSFEGRTCEISASIGIAVSLGYGAEDSERLLADADEALYTAKRAGRGRCVLAPVPGEAEPV